MGKEFLGSNFESREGIYDENVILRTNYPYVIKKQMDLFPLKNDKSYCVVYTNPITVIRDTNYNPLNHDQIFKVGLITTCYERRNNLLTEKEISILSSQDLLNFQMCVENSFQAAICGSHDIIILPLFCKEFGAPIVDQISVFNHTIIKYGHKFKGIMICIPPYEGKDIFEDFDKEILKPNYIVRDIDMKYQAEEMTKRINSNDNSKNKDDNDSDILKKITKKRSK